MTIDEMLGVGDNLLTEWGVELFGSSIRLNSYASHILTPHTQHFKLNILLQKSEAEAEEKKCIRVTQ